MKYNKGERVKHPTRDDWGLGEVLTGSDGKSVRIFFVNAGEKIISLDIIQPIQVAGVEAAHPVLDNLKIDKSESVIKYQSLAESIQFFLKEYPEGFYGEKYKKDERDYKFEAHKLALELLDKEAFHSLLEQQDYLEIRKRALKVINKKTIISQYEKKSLSCPLEKLATVPIPSRRSFPASLEPAEFRGVLHRFSSAREQTTIRRTTSTFITNAITPRVSKG